MIKAIEDLKVVLKSATTSLLALHTAFSHGLPDPEATKLAIQKIIDLQTESLKLTDKFELFAVMLLKPRPTLPKLPEAAQPKKQATEEKKTLQKGPSICKGNCHLLGEAMSSII